MEILTKNEIMDEIEENFSEWFEVKERLSEGLSPSNFTGGVKPTMPKEFFGLINPIQWIEESPTGQILTANELENISDEWEYKNSDNTYNYNGYLARECAMQVFENEEKEVLVFLSFHVGIDIRAGYTNHFAMLFDDEYEYLEFLTQIIPIAEFRATINGKECNICVDGEACSESTRIYITKLDEQYEYSLDLYDRETALSDLKEFLVDNDFEVSDLVVCE